MIFLDWWKKLNAGLAQRGEPEALYGEARDWYEYRPNWKNLDPTQPENERILNIIINHRKPV